MPSEYDEWLDAANAEFRKESEKDIEVGNDSKFTSAPAAEPEKPSIPDIAAACKHETNWLLLAVAFAGGFIASKLAGRK